MRENGWIAFAAIRARLDGMTHHDLGHLPQLKTALESTK